MKLGYAILALGLATPALAMASGETVTTIFEHPLPNAPGKSLITLTVDYAPGGVGAPHLHPKSAFIYAYVLSGAVESQINGGTKRVYHAGEGFYEPPGSTHNVSRNASKTEPAKMYVVFVVDSNDKPLTTPIK